LTGILLADSGRVWTDADGGLSGGNEVRGQVTPPEQEKYPPPPAPAEPHLTYSQKSGQLNGPDGKPLAVGYAGRGGGQNNPGTEGIKGVGPLPRGNWKVEELKTSPWPDPAYKLTPDEETRKRVIALGRDPDSFYVHAQARLPQDRGRDSAGCIALEKPDREKLKPFNKEWIRVEK